MGLHEECAEGWRTAALAQRRSARILAESRRWRGELMRAWLPRDTSCGAVARRLVEQHLGSASSDDIADANMVVSELVNNAFLHGKGSIQLRISSRPGRTRVEVIDQGEGAGIRAGQHEGHHGLNIVDALSLAWGAREGSTHVWAELPVRGAAADRTPRRRTQIDRSLEQDPDASRVELEPDPGA